MVVGLATIGMPIARFGQALGMHVIVTPHNASSSGNDRRGAEIFLRNLEKFSRGENLLNQLPQSYCVINRTPLALDGRGAGERVNA